MAVPGTAVPAHPPGNADVWTPYTSLDGSKWTKAGPAVGVEHVGTWIGLYATLHSSGHQIQAVFDHVSGFTLATFVRIGKP